MKPKYLMKYLKYKNMWSLVHNYVYRIAYYIHNCYVLLLHRDVTYPFPPSVPIWHRLADIFDFFFWASRLWVGWQKEPISGYVPENDKKKEFRMKRVNVNLFSYMLFMLDAIIFKRSLCFYLHYKTYICISYAYVLRMLNWPYIRKNYFQKGVMYLHLYCIYVLQQIYLQNVASK